MRATDPKPDYYAPGDHATEVPCPRCEAKVGDRCTTLSGKVTEPHTSRWVPLSEAYAAGYTEAQAERP